MHVARAHAAVFKESVQALTPEARGALQARRPHDSPLAPSALSSGENDLSFSVAVAGVAGAVSSAFETSSARMVAHTRRLIITPLVSLCRWC